MGGFPRNLTPHPQPGTSLAVTGGHSQTRQGNSDLSDARLVRARNRERLEIGLEDLGGFDNTRSGPCPAWK